MKFIAFVLSFLTTLSNAAPPGPSVMSIPSHLSLWEMLVAAGWVMIPLFAVSVAAVTLIIFYFATLRRGRVATEELKRNMEKMIADRNFGGVLEAARGSPEALARVMERSVEFLQTNPEADIAAVREVAQAEGNRQVASLNQQVVYLMDIGVLAPMLGLFGTVIGILRSFGSIASEATPMRTMVLAGGVSQALVATAAGLLVGITAMFFYSYFRGRVQGLVSDLETFATSLVTQIGVKLKK